tara:strand:+ start:481 stop:1314 length:834 start_codon:yes stop_codon:yes gene_type:complete
MRNFKIGIIKIILLIGSKTILGRGLLRKILIYFIETIIKTIKFNKSKPLFVTNFYDFKIYYYADKQTGTKLYFSRNETKEINFIKKKIENNSWFIDIGSNIGLYSLNISNLNTKYKKVKTFSIEPNPIVYHRLKKNYQLLVSQNKFVKNNFLLKNLAIGDKEGFGKIDKNVDHANVKIIKKLTNKNNFLRIRIEKLSSLLKKYKIENISCIKIDTEGYELKIIKNFFKRNNLKFFPKYLIVEHNNEKNYIRNEQIILKNNYEIIFTTNSNTIYKKNV